MLSELTIKNFIIIEKLTIRFRDGFNVLTGETGAGKSILIDAIDLILGGKARPETIRNGEDEAQIEALFDLQNIPALRAGLEEAGLDSGDDLVVRRVINRSGKNRIYLNGSLATAAQLQQWISRIVAIYGQHEQLGLIRAENHGLLLDSFAGIEGKIAIYRQAFDQARKVRDELVRLDAAERERQQRLDLLKYQHHEIADASIIPGEDEALAAERLVLQSAERLAKAAGEGHEKLYGSQGAVCETVAGVVASLRELCKVDATLAGAVEALDTAYYSLEDIAAQLLDYSRKVTIDSERQAEVEERLATLATLKRKYGPRLEDVIRFGEEVALEFRKLSDIDGTRRELTTQLDCLDLEVVDLGKGLTDARRAAAATLQRAVESELGDLAMARARFEIRLLLLSEAGARGFEKVEFYLQANPGEEPRPLARVASGGELSRLMLAIKRAAPIGDEVETLIFDEVDAGIGGAAATAVGEKLRAVALGKQVLCITHLPQVAAFARHHYQVSKEETPDGRTRVEVLELDNDQRVVEVARMLGGAKLSEQSLLHARELIEMSRLSEVTAEVAR